MTVSCWEKASDGKEFLDSISGLKVCRMVREFEPPIQAEIESLASITDTYPDFPVPPNAVEVSLDEVFSFGDGGLEVFLSNGSRIGFGISDSCCSVAFSTDGFDDDPVPLEQNDVNLHQSWLDASLCSYWKRFLGKQIDFFEILTWLNPAPIGKVGRPNEKGLRINFTDGSYFIVSASMHHRVGQLSVIQVDQIHPSIEYETTRI